MKILVTGAAGFIGSHLAERLCGLGHEVVGVDCFSPYYARGLKDLNAQDVARAGGKIVELDLARDQLTALLEGVAAVYHLAGQPGISATTPFDEYLRNNLVATHRLLEAAQGSGCLDYFVNISTSSVYGAYATGPEDTPPAPTSYYGVTKLGAEQLVMAYQRERGFPACSLRLFSVYGERERPEKLYPKLIRSILEDSDFPLHEGSKSHSRSFTYVGDIVDGLVAVLEHREACLGEIVNIGSDVETTTAEGMRIVEELLGKKAKIVVTPQRPGDQLRTYANIEKARRLLGYAPQTKPEEGLKAEVEWFKGKVLGKIES